MLRKILLGAVILLLAYIVGYVSLSYYHYRTTPQWKKQFIGLSKLDIVEDSEFSVKYQQDANHITYDLLLADNWSSKEVDDLLGFMDIPPVRDDQLSGKNFDIGLAEMWFNKNDAILTIAERFRVGAPIDEDQRQVLIDQLTAGIYQTASFQEFSNAAAYVAISGLADTPGPIRDRLMYIYEHPRETFGEKGLSVAENIKRQLKGRGAFMLDGKGDG